MDELVFRNLEDRRALKRNQSIERSALKDERIALTQDRQRFENLRNSRNRRSHDGPSFER